MTFHPHAVNYWPLITTEEKSLDASVQLSMHSHTFPPTRFMHSFYFRIIFSRFIMLLCFSCSVFYMLSLHHKHCVLFMLFSDLNVFNAKSVVGFRAKLS